MNPYPVNLDLRGRKVLLVGGGRVAYRKLEELHRAGADITVVSPELLPDTAERVEAWAIHLERRKFRTADAAGCFLVISAADSDTVNRRVASAARQCGALVNVVDNAELSDFSLPATVMRGNLLLTASTGGALPAFSRRIRERLELAFGEEYGAYLELAGALRPIIMRKVPDPVQRREIFFRLADFDLVALHANAPVSFRRMLDRLLPPEVAAELDAEFPIPGQDREVSGAAGDRGTR